MENVPRSGHLLEADPDKACYDLIVINVSFQERTRDRRRQINVRQQYRTRIRRHSSKLRVAAGQHTDRINARRTIGDSHTSIQGENVTKAIVCGIRAVHIL